MPNVTPDSTSVKPLVDEKKIVGDMKTEEPDGWDLAPQNISDPRQQRHPRPDGVGGAKKVDEEITPLERYDQREEQRKEQRKD